MEIEFLLNGETVRAETDSATHTLLDWIRETRGLKGTKEGCNEGDCGACTVMVTDENGSRAVNSCILFMPQIHGKSVRTVEGIASPDGNLHPVQQAMIDHHGSQCGFCTPGFIVSMATAHKNGASDFDDQLAGNLCRCTGYAPIIRAAQAASREPRAQWLDDQKIHAGEIVSDQVFLPKTTDDLAKWYIENPDGVLVGGATDVGLWVTKQLKDLGKVAFLSGISDMRQIKVGNNHIEVGAAATAAEFGRVIADHYPSFAELIRRFGSVQVRNSATIGGNIANGSPIGDSPPALIALGAKLRLRRSSETRTIDLEDFFVDYGKQDRRPSEFVEAVLIPRQSDRLGCYKLSKRFDQDISAVCGCFSIGVSDGKVTNARIAFGGMAATPKRARHVETALIGSDWDEASVHAALPEFEEDFSPLNDMRASADYRMTSAKNMLLKYLHQDLGTGVSVLEVSP